MLLVWIPPASLRESTVGATSTEASSVGASVGTADGSGLPERPNSFTLQIIT